eukprot:m.76859 g.76859  ORF g.76859 m.76859 type:complete len:471 (+) comp9093_c0_seq1:77-1489(+)
MSFFRKSKKKDRKSKEPEFDGQDAPPPVAPYQGDGGTGASAAVGAAPSRHDRDGSRRQRGNFMEKPQDGWKHDDRGMAAGMGVYFTFTVKYVGAMVMPKSITSTAPDSTEMQTDITREIIARVCDKCVPERDIRDRKLSKHAANYPYGIIKPRNKLVGLSISANGIVLALPPPRKDGIFGFYPMRNISLATGGEDQDYDYISFTARDEHTMEREGHVFDCDVQSDAVMEALGQAFALARQLQSQGAKKSSLEPKYLDVVPEAARGAMAPPPGAENLYAELDSMVRRGAENPMYDGRGGGTAEASYLDVKPVRQQPPGSSGYMEMRGGHPGGATGGGAHYLDVKPTRDTTGAGGGATYLDVAPNQAAAGRSEPPAYLDVAPNDPVGFTLAQNLAQGEALYDSADGAIGQRVADVLNRHDLYMDVAVNQGRNAGGADGDYLQLPAWRAYDDAALTNRLNIDEFDDEALYGDL